MIPREQQRKAMRKHKSFPRAVDIITTETEVSELSSDDAEYRRNAAERIIEEIISPMEQDHEHTLACVHADYRDKLERLTERLYDAAKGYRGAWKLAHESDRQRCRKAAGL